MEVKNAVPVIRKVTMSYDTPMTIRNAFDKTEKTVAESVGLVGDINVSSIATEIIHEVGRYAESYASDFLVNWKTVTDLLDAINAASDDDSIVVFGIRRSGVDHTPFLMNQLRQQTSGGHGFVFPEHIYRSIMAVRVVRKDGAATVTLKRIMDNLYDFCEEDREEGLAIGKIAEREKCEV